MLRQVMVESLVCVPAILNANKLKGYVTHLFLCPAKVERYKAISQEIRTIFLNHTNIVEPLSLDEAYLDVTENKKGFLSIPQLAQAIREGDFQQTGLTASAGVSVNKFVTKIARHRQPNGQKNDSS